MSKTNDPQQLRAVALFSKDEAGTKQRLLLAAVRSDNEDFAPSASLCWWYRPDKGAQQEASWTPLPERGYHREQEMNRVIELYPQWLEQPPDQRDNMYMTVTSSAADRPINGGGLRITVPRGLSTVSPGLPPTFPHDTTGTGGDRNPVRPVAVSMSRTSVPNTEDEILWVVIRNSARSMGFDRYQSIMDALFDDRRVTQVIDPDKKAVLDALKFTDRFSFANMDAYKVLKAATEWFVMTNCGVVRPQSLGAKVSVEEARLGHSLTGDFNDLWKDYLDPPDRPLEEQAHILPYLDIIQRKLGASTAINARHANLRDRQSCLLQDKLANPCLIELIWAYWHDEAMLVQAFNSITRRFQNLRAHGERDPLAQLELDPLRPLNNLLWGWVQDEQSQLSVLRRAHEYAHQYGFTLHGKALAELRSADRRSKFLESFHNLLWKCMQFYRQDDDTTVIADGFAILNALKETHYVLAHGAHNQFGNMPSTARQEMLMQQWILSRPEMREFLGGRIMVPYPEAWMDRVDAVKTLKGWTDTSVVHFRDLAVFGEQLLLSVRWGAWSTVDDPNSAANWARYWRAEVQGYIHAYRAATSVDLTTDITDQRQAQTRFLAPSVHLRNRLLARAAR